MKGWRLSNHTSLDGFGGTVASGRWHHKGSAVVYLSSCASTSLLEILVHLDLGLEDIPSGYQLLEIDIPDDVKIEDVVESELPIDWRERTDLSRSIGDKWLNSGHSAILRVPCAIIPETNLLFNPDHPDGNRITVSHSSPYRIDQRLEW